VSTRLSTITFTVVAHEVTPVVDGRSLTDLATEFETSREMEQSGGYAGVAHVHQRFGPLDAFYLGESEWTEKGFTELLSCAGCGEVGCWPLEAKIVVTDATVTWEGLRQPHRPERDYRGLGPFIFSTSEYDAAVTSAAPR